MEKNPQFIDAYTLVVAHNLPRPTLDKLAAYLWVDPARPPLIVIRTAGFLAEFYLQCHEHTGTRPSLLVFLFPVGYRTKH